MRKRRAAERAAKAVGKTDFEQVHPAEPLDWRKGKTPEQIAHLEDLGQKVREALRQAEEGLDLEREGLLEIREAAPELLEVALELLAAHEKLIDDYNKLVDDYNALLDDDDEPKKKISRLIEPPEGER